MLEFLPISKFNLTIFSIELNSLCEFLLRGLQKLEELELSKNLLFKHINHFKFKFHLFVCKKYSVNCRQKLLKELKA